MKSKVHAYISKYGLLNERGRYLVALSGGADSVALLRILLELGYAVEAAHCNFKLRGDESDRDELFCKELCGRLNVPLHIAHFDTRTFATLHKISIEMAARDLRYNYLFQLLADLNLDAVCVAHHRDDSVETILLNMVRGTGIDGLTGMAPVNGKVVRPMLCVDRVQIVDYLDSINQGFITDSTNLKDDVQRNKVRLNVIPELLRVSTAAVENINRMSSNLQGVAEIYHTAIETAKKRVVDCDNDTTMIISISRLQSEVAHETLLWELLKGKSFSSAQVAQICIALDAQSGREWRSSTHNLLVDRDVIIVEKNEEDAFPEMRIPECGNYNCKDRQFRFEKKTKDSTFQISKDPYRVTLDYDKIVFPLTIRNTREGDAFVPFGMKGRKLLSDFLTDRKLTLFEKRRQIVVEDAKGVIVWVVGHRTDNRVAVTPQTTNVLEISIK